jgi:hypothetical protein
MHSFFFKSIAPIAVSTFACLAFNAFAINAVNPTGVNVRSNAPNTVFLTFQGLEANERAVEALWCGAVQPGIGAGSVGTSDPCASGTLFGRLPLNFDRSRATLGIGQTNFTDIMTIPASVVRRAVQQGIEGKNSDFFYVRRFTGGSSGDKWVVVTCRLGAGGARTPLSLIDVKLGFTNQSDSTRIFLVKSGERLPRFFAEIQYNGAGQLKGRWELVRPGDNEPETNDLLTEATLPLELRATQRRYQTIARFSQFLSPNSTTRIEGPDPTLLDTRIEGPYQVLLRIEASDDREANSEIGGGQIVKAGGVAGFSMPTLRYFVGDVADSARLRAESPRAIAETNALGLMLPLTDATIDPARNATFEWIEAIGAANYRIEIESDGKLVIASQVPSTRYTPPPTWLATRVRGTTRWRVTALDANGRAIAQSTTRRFSLKD